MKIYGDIAQNFYLMSNRNDQHENPQFQTAMEQEKKVTTIFNNESRKK